MLVYDRENRTITENDSRIVKPGERNINQLGNYSEIKYVINLICLCALPPVELEILYDKNAYFHQRRQMSYRVCPFRSHFDDSCFTHASRINLLFVII